MKYTCIVCQIWLSWRKNYCHIFFPWHTIILQKEWQRDKLWLFRLQCLSDIFLKIHLFKVKLMHLAINSLVAKITIKTLVGLFYTFTEQKLNQYVIQLFTNIVFLFFFFFCINTHEYCVNHVFLVALRPCYHYVWLTSQMSYHLSCFSGSAFLLSFVSWH